MAICVDKRQAFVPSRRGSQGAHCPYESIDGRHLTGLVDHGTGDPLSPLDMKSGKVLGELVWPEEDCRVLWATGSVHEVGGVMSDHENDAARCQGFNGPPKRPAALLRGKVEVHHRDCVE